MEHSKGAKKNMMELKDVNHDLISERDKLKSTLEKLVLLLKHKDCQINEKDLEIGALNSIIQSLMIENKNKDERNRKNQIRISALQEKINVLHLRNMEMFQKTSDHESDDGFDNDRKSDDGISMKCKEN